MRIYTLCAIIGLLSGSGSLFAAAPVAACNANVNVSLPPDDCVAYLRPEHIDAGSYDPDGDAISLTLSNDGPYGPGFHWVYLYVSDGTHTRSCWSRIYVEDKTDPIVTCNSRTYYLVAPDQPVTVDIGQLINASDNCVVDEEFFSFSVLDGYGTVPYTYTAEDDFGNSATCSNAYHFVDGEPQNYCSSTRNASYEHIRRVYMNGAGLSLERVSGNDGGYHWEYPNGPHTLYHGWNYQLAYSPGFRYSSVYRLYWQVYIDKNRDGDFYDSGELLHQWNGTGNNAFNFTSPGTTTGYTRIRVVMNYGGYAGPCGGYWGEVEDYSVWMGPFIFIPWPGFRPPADAFAAADLVPTKEDDLVFPGEFTGPERPELSTEPTTVAVAEEVTLYPNPLRSGETLRVKGSTVPQTVITRNMLGRVVNRQALGADAGGQKLNLPDLPPGTYLVSGYAEDGTLRWTRKLAIQR